MEPMQFRLWLSCGALATTLGVLYACSSSTVAPPTTSETCESYCSRMVSVCSGDNNPFPADPEKGVKGTCLRVCANWASGTTNGGGNTLACRAKILSSAREAAGAELVASCTNAGPISSACGGNCETFCALNVAVCTGTTSQYASETECVAQCKTSMAPGLETSIVNAKEGGNTITCRAYHTIVASGSETDRVTHCPHAGNPASSHCVATAIADAGTDAPTSD